MISIRNLHKSYPAKNSKESKRGLLKAISNVSIEVAQGESMVVLGYNGSGKSTLLSLLGGQIRSYDGSIRIEDIEISKYPRKHPIAYAADHPNFPVNWTVSQLLWFTARIQGMSSKVTKEKIDFVTKQFELSAFLERRMGNLSKGMKQRANLAQSLISESNIIIWDEPTTGLDWKHLSQVKNCILDYKKQGVTWVVSTHDISFAKSIADRFLHLKYGEMIFDGTPKDWDAFVVSADPHVANLLQNQLPIDSTSNVPSKSNIIA